MIKQQDVHVFTGMQRDISISKLKAEFLYDGLNVRLTAREGDNMYSLTNELGTKKILDFTGMYLGHCVLGNFLVIFAKDVNSNTDYIYRVQKSGSLFLMTTLYLGNLNFKINTPIETLGAYENENILKVYWTDGVNQPRVINIVKDRLSPKIKYNDTSFDFVLDLQLKEKVKVVKEASSSGLFGAGCIQYAITYFNKYGQESNIAYTTPIYYTNFSDRAASPEDRVGVAFRVKVYNVDTNFEYLRLYSIFRSSLDVVPTVKRVIDLELGSSPGGTKRFLGIIESSDNLYEITLGDIFISEGLGWKQVESYTNHKGTFSPQDIIGTYWKFTKEEFPYLIIKYTNEEGVVRYITWNTATELYIYEGTVTEGPKPNDTRIILSGEGSFNVCTRASYSDLLSEVGIVDDNSTGDIVDPSSLLYVGGETITATTLASKDGTLFLGNLSIERPSIPKEIKDLAKLLTVESGTRTVYFPSTMYGNYYKWGNTLNAYDNVSEKTCTNIAGFKWMEHYRLGVQFLYKSGKWSEPVFINDAIQKEKPSGSILSKNSTIKVPKFSITLSSEMCSNLKNLGYKKARAVAVFPSLQDRLVLTQGLLCPTVFSLASRYLKNIYAQSSWFTRPFTDYLKNSMNDWPNDATEKTDNLLAKYSTDIIKENNGANAIRGSYLLCHHLYSLFGNRDRGAEIQGVPPVLCGMPTDSILKSVKDGIIIREDNRHTNNGEIITEETALGNIFGVDQLILTYHSPDILFDDGISAIDLEGFNLRRVGHVKFRGSQGDISIQTKTPTIGASSSGFYHRSTTSDKGRSLSAGLFYSDYLVDDKNKGEAYADLHYDFLYMIYPWHKTGSLNNDVVRDGQSAQLLKKKISNIMWTQSELSSYRDGNTSNLLAEEYGKLDMASSPLLFSSSEMQLVKIKDTTDDSKKSYNYYGNVDSVLVPPARYGSIFTTGVGLDNKAILTLTSLTGNVKFTEAASDFWFLQKYGAYQGVDWNIREGEIGDAGSRSLFRHTKGLIRMKYKSTPHIVVKLSSHMGAFDINYSPSFDRLYLAELYREEKDSDFGGKSDFALKENLWIPVGDPVTLPDDSVEVDFIYGDTWYQRYDCLKTYPFTQEDENSIVDIVSFVCETRVNIDGRYDRNRGNSSNLYMSPINFNLLNPIYSLKNNFFNYRILDLDYYNLNHFPTTITWSTLKLSASEVDAWTTITMASTLDLDGDKGAVTSLKVSQDNVYCFQERGISQVLFNSRVQIPASDGVPIEISNSYKVDGNRYISENIGCTNKWSICSSPSGLYFIDSVGKSLMLLSNNLLSSISDTHGFGQWFDTLDTLEWGWQSSHLVINSPITMQSLDNTSAATSPFSIINKYLWKGTKVFYDFNNNDLYTVTSSSALCLSELLSQFTSFYSYGQSLAMFNIGSDFFSIHNNSIWKLFSGSHNNFFGSIKPSYFTFVSNQNNGKDKIFSNLELRADFYDSNNELKTYNFFNSILAWNEYQDTGVVTLSPRERNRASHPYNVKRKFRIWGVDIPRDKTHKRDRIRNPWTKIKLSFTPNDLVEKFELHDVGVTYYI